MAIPNVINYDFSLLTEHFIVRAANGYRAVEEITVASGAGKVLRGTVLGARTRGAAAAPATAPATGNVGNATVGTVTMDAQAPAGIYRVRFLTATTYALFDPGGVELIRGATGTALNSVINFTITAGATPMVAGDGFNITIAYAAGSKEFVPADEAANDGSEVASCILYDTVDTTLTAQRGVGVFRDCEVQTAMLAFAGTPSAGFKTSCYAALAAAGVAFR